MFAIWTSLRVWAGGSGSSINLKPSTNIFDYFICHHQSLIIFRADFLYKVPVLTIYIVRGLHLPYLEARYVWWIAILGKILQNVGSLKAGCGGAYLQFIVKSLYLPILEGGYICWTCHPWNNFEGGGVRWTISVIWLSFH